MLSLAARAGSPWSAGLGLILATALVPTAIEGQVAQLRVGYGVSALSTSDWTPVHGPSIGLEFQAWPGWGISVEYRDASRGRGEVTGYCGFEFCVEGPFAEEVFLRSVGLGLDRRILEDERLEVRVALQGRLFAQGRHMTDVETGEEFDRSRVVDAGYGARIEARSRSGIRGLIPLAWMAYHRLSPTGCPSDGTCYGGRNHVEIGLGLMFGL
jgi:hypothetical protein